MTEAPPPHRQPAGLARLPALAPLPTVAERAAGLIREYIFEGKFMPGTPLPENSLAQALQVSRNTVREAFRALINEHLLVYEAHKGVAVRSLMATDVRDVYALRRLFELSAVDLLGAGGGALDLDALDRSVCAAENAVRDRRWDDVGTADLRFHEIIVGAHGSPRMDEFFRRLMTEMRLGFLAAADPEALHGPFVPRNRDIFRLLSGDHHGPARQALARYLDDAETVVLNSVAPRDATNG
jgi:DNA-binding GntR family transcriptional regulator